MKKMLKTLLALTIAVPVAMSATAAIASTAANTTITNTATLTYSGGSKSATALVTVSLIPATPTILLNGNNAGYLDTNSPVLGNSLLLTSNANGPASYHVTAVVGSAGAQAQVNNANSGSVTDGGGFDVSLGASVTTASVAHQSTATTLVIPAPNAANVSGGPGTWVVNGLSVGSTVKYSTFAANISGITQNIDSTFTLTLDAAGGVVPAGTPVYEQKTVPGITSLPGTVAVLGTNIDVYSQATVSTTGAADAVSNWAKTFWTSSLASTELNKYVRNLTPAGNPAVGSACDIAGTNFTVNTSNNRYYNSSCVTGKTLDVLEYVVLAKNTSTTTDLTSSAISDQLPTAYVTFNFGSYGGNDVFYSPDGSGSGTSGSIAAGAGANLASFNPWPFPATVPPSVTLTVNVGSGATAASPGTIAKVVPPATANALFIAYKVTIK